MEWLAIDDKDNVPPNGYILVTNGKQVDVSEVMMVDGTLMTRGFGHLKSCPTHWLPLSVLPKIKGKDTWKKT